MIKAWPNYELEKIKAMTLQTAGLVKSLTFFAFVQELIGCFDLCMTPEEENRRFSSILIF